MKDTLDLATGRGDKINFTKMMDIRDDDFLELLLKCHSWATYPMYSHTFSDSPDKSHLKIKNHTPALSKESVVPGHVLLAQIYV